MSDQRTQDEKKDASPARKGRVPSRNSNRLSGAQVTFAAILAIGLILAINFSSRLASARPLNEYYQGVQDEIEALRQEQATLIAERDFAQSDAFIQQWARSEGKMVRPGEILIVPLALGSTPVPTIIPEVFVEQETTRPEPENWELWWSLFFDSDPPNF
jgi:cell division protein FtsB